MSSTPRRTPLYDRHLAAGAKLIEFAGWEMPVEYEGAGVRAEHMAVRESAGVFDVSHMGQIETSGAQALGLLQRLLSNDVSAISYAAAADSIHATGGAQYSVLCRDDGGVLDDLFTYRLDGDRYLTVTNAANHAADLQWFQEHALEFPRARVGDMIDRYAMLAVQGPQAREIVQTISDSPLPRRMTAASRRLAGDDVLVCGTGYTGEEGVELLCAPEHAPALWDELVRRGAVPAGLAARDTLRLEACYCLYGNELTVRRNPIEAGLGWCCREQTGFVGSEAVAAARADAKHQALVAFAIEGPGIARAGNHVEGGGQVTSGTLSPCLGRGIGMAYVPARHAAVGTALQIDVRGKMRAAVVADKPLYRKPAPARELLADASYPEDLLYHPDHDWARIEGDQATLGITWFAQETLGEVVFFEPPAVGSNISKDSPYAEVESVKAVSDVIAPLSGEIVAVNDTLADDPQTINEDPYGEGWLVRVRVSDPAESETLLDAASYAASLAS